MLLPTAALAFAVALAPQPAFAAATCHDAAEMPVAGASFTVRRSGESWSWDARFIPRVDPAIAVTDLAVIRFAAPLPLGESLRPTAGLSPVFENDDPRAAIVGICLEPGEAYHDGVVHASFDQPRPPDEGGALGAPIARGSAVQVLEAADSADAAIELRARGFVRHVGFVAPESVDHAAREEALRLLSLPPLAVENAPIFVRGDDVARQGPLFGRVVDPRAKARSTSVGAALIFAALVSGLAVVARRLRSRARAERDDALLASEIDDAVRSRGIQASGALHR